MTITYAEALKLQAAIIARRTLHSDAFRNFGTDAKAIARAEAVKTAHER